MKFSRERHDSTDKKRTTKPGAISNSTRIRAYLSFARFLANSSGRKGGRDRGAEFCWWGEDTRESGTGGKYRRVFWQLFKRCISENQFRAVKSPASLSCRFVGVGRKIKASRSEIRGGALQKEKKRGGRGEGEIQFSSHPSRNFNFESAGGGEGRSS